MKQTIFSLVMLSLYGMVGVIAQSNELVLGQPIEGTLTEDQLIVDYPFSADEGDRLTINISSSQFDTLLVVTDSEGQVVVSNDDANGSLNSEIDTYIVTHKDDYILSVTSSDGKEVGEYELIFNQTHLESLKYGDSVQGILDETTPEIVYQFDGRKGDVITIQMSSSTLDSFLTLSNSEYDMISDADSGGALNSMIGAYPLPATGNYTIRASKNSYDPDGEFIVTLDKVEATPIKINEPIEGRMSNKPVYYSLTLDRGTVISMNVVSDDGLLDTILNIQHAEYGYSLGYDDDSGYYYDPEINNLFINEAGEYIIMVIPALPNTEGEFVLNTSTKPSDILECDSSQILSFNQKTSQIIYTMDLKARQNVTFTFFGDNASLASLYSNYTLNGEYLSVDFINDIDGQTMVDIQAPFSGQLSIIVSDYAFRLHSFRFDVSCS